MDPTDFIKQAHDRYSLFQTLWNMYFAVSFAIPGFLVNAKFPSKRIHWAAKGIAIAAYSGFAVANLGGLLRTRDQQATLVNLARDLPPNHDPKLARDFQQLICLATPRSDTTIFLTYTGACLIIIALILLIPRASPQQSDKVV